MATGDGYRSGDRWNRLGIAAIVLVVVMDVAVALAFARAGFDVAWFWPLP